MEEFQQFERRIMDCLNINLANYKPKQMQRRILSRMKRCGYSSLDDYAQGIASDEKVRQTFLNHITINVTEFFRNRAHFERLDGVLSEKIEERAGRLKVWSAACSSGAEPYTLSMMLSGHPGLSYEILGTDIDQWMLEKSQRALYQEQELKGLSEADITSFLDKEGSAYRIKDKIRRPVSFKKHDLIQDLYPGPFDLIVCRNVLIYFTPDTQQSIFRKFHQALGPGGILFIGATESMHEAATMGFKKKQVSIFEKI